MWWKIYNRFKGFSSSLAPARLKSDLLFIIYYAVRLNTILTVTPSNIHFLNLFIMYFLPEFFFQLLGLIALLLVSDFNFQLGRVKRQIITAHAHPFRGARDLAFCLKVPLDSLLVWASSGGSGETAWMCRLAWTVAARICLKYRIRLARPN